MDVSEFNYDLPREFIAQYPLEKRDEAKLLVLDRKTGQIEHGIFKDIADYFEPGDCLVLNDTRVMPARLFGTKPTGGKVEILLVHRKENNVWQTLVNPGRRTKTGQEIMFKEGLLRAKILDRAGNGQWTVEFAFDGDFFKILDQVGVPPLPHYINRPAEPVDRRTYQTVYAHEPGAIAAPTAGLHFTPEVLAAVETRGVKTAFVTLHIGIGTFKPIKTERVEAHVMDAEHYEIRPAASEVMERADRVVGVGTSAVRTLEHSALHGNQATGWADIFIFPGFQFKVTDRLITNFHLPCSTPLLLVSAFAGKDMIFRAYEEAKKKNYRFLSYGDAMLIL